MIRLLVLRPQPGADASAARARDMGLVPLVAPLFEIHPVAWDAPEPSAFDAVLITSANAARHAGPGLSAFTGLPVHAVGAASAEAARAFGFKTVHTGMGDAAAALAQAVAAGHRRLFHPAGREHVAPDPGSAEVTRRIVYASERLPPPELPRDEPLVALLHSTRTANVFAGRCPRRDRIALAAISPAVAMAAGTGWHAIATAAAPDDESLLAVAARLCNQEPW